MFCIVESRVFDQIHPFSNVKNKTDNSILSKKLYFQSFKSTQTKTKY